MEGASSTGYDSYDLYDLGEFDQKGAIRTKYGTKEEFIEAVAAARKRVSRCIRTLSSITWEALMNMRQLLYGK